MAIQRKQYTQMIIDVDDIVAVQQGGKTVYTFSEVECYNPRSKSVKSPIAESRIFRMFSTTREENWTVTFDDENNPVIDKETLKYETTPPLSAREFVVINFSKSENSLAIKTILAKGVQITLLDGTTMLYKRVGSSASKTRVGKRLFTSFDPHVVRQTISFNGRFSAEMVIAQLEARYGQAQSSTIEITKEDFSFDIMPDFAITRKHDVIRYDWKKSKLIRTRNFEETYEPLDGQGTILPSAAVRTAHRLQLISRNERKLLLEWLELYDQDVKEAIADDNQEFLRMWRKIPSAFQVRFGFAKGLLLVHPHNKESKDCNGKTYRTTGKCMAFFGEEKHEYDFSKDIMFTDSMWKENFDPKFVTDEVPANKRAKLEVVLWQKNRMSDKVFMGNQYWQAIDMGIASPKQYADEAIKELKDTIFTDPDEAKAFLGIYDSGNDPNELAEKGEAAGGKIQKVIQLLNELPDIIKEPYVQKTIRETRRKYIADMATGRIPVKGHNPYVITAPELQFGRESLVKAGEYYYNGVVDRFACFRSPLIHKSEATVINTIDVPEYHGFYNGLLIMNPYDDICPRMGGMDTDGDKIAMIRNDQICDAVYKDLAMLYDKGFKAEPQPITDKAIWKYDIATIITDVLTIGEITNMALSWKDIASNPDELDELGMTAGGVNKIVCILRFMQGWSIDYAKTGFFPDIPDYVMTKLSPMWKPWSARQAEKNIKGARVYKSVSQLGQLHTSITDYMTNKFDQEVTEHTTDFTFEVTAGADHAEIDRIKPIIAQMEGNYRSELDKMREMELSEDERNAHLTGIFDKYQNAMLSIDSDVTNIGAAAYLHTYFENGSKMKSISFPWITAYEGILMNLAHVEDADRFKLRKAKFTGHIDDVPQTLKFYRGEATGEDYSVQAKVKNGTYETFRRNGQLFVKMEMKSIALKKKFKAPAIKTVAFNVKGFRYFDTNSADVLALLKENDGIVNLAIEKNNGETRAVLSVADRQIGVVGRDSKHIIKQYVADGGSQFQILNMDQLTPTYVDAKGRKRYHVFFSLELQFLKALEMETVDEPGEVAGEEHTYVPSDDEGYAPEYYGEEGHPSDTDAPIEYDWDEDEETPVVAFDPDVLAAINKSASYWNRPVSEFNSNIVGIEIEQTGAMKIGQVCAQITATTAKGTSYTFDVKVEAKNTFGIVSEKRMNASVSDMLLQFAHYELYVSAKSKKQA